MIDYSGMSTDQTKVWLELTAALADAGVVVEKTADHGLYGVLVDVTRGVRLPYFVVVDPGRITIGRRERAVFVWLSGQLFSDGVDTVIADINTRRRQLGLIP